MCPWELEWLRMVRSRLVVVAVCVLLLGTLLLEARPVPSVRANPGTLLVPSQYPTIQAAINAAVAGDTVIVSAGTYVENVLITKSVQLVGESRNNTFIDASGGAAPGINITGTGSVLVSGFTVEKTNLPYGEVLVSSSTDVVITRNRLRSVLDPAEVNGTYVYNSSNVTVSDNVLTGNLYGVALQGGFSNVVALNNATGNTIGVGVFNSVSNRIMDNRMVLGKAGLDLWDGATGNTVTGNLIGNNTEDGISLVSQRFRSGDHFIVGNDIEYNSAQGGFSSVGLDVQNSTGNSFYHNNFRGNDIQVFVVFPPGDLTGNVWDDGSRGSYWADYAGLDDGSGGRVAGDGVGDTNVPHPCPNGGNPCMRQDVTLPGVDRFPLMSPFVASPGESTGSILVRVRNVGGQPVEGSRVRSVSQPSGQRALNGTTNNFGLTGFSGLAPGGYRLEASGSGFVAQEKTVTAVANQTVTVEFSLASSQGPSLFSPVLVGGIVVAAAVVAGGLGFWWWRRRRVRVALAK